MLIQKYRCVRAGRILVNGCVQIDTKDWGGETRGA
jgi:hypothetical protein